MEPPACCFAQPATAASEPRLHPSANFSLAGSPPAGTAWCWHTAMSTRPHSPYGLRPVPTRPRFYPPLPLPAGAPFDGSWDGFVDLSREIMRGRNSKEQQETVAGVLAGLLPPQVGRAGALRGASLGARLLGSNLETCRRCAGAGGWLVLGLFVSRRLRWPPTRVSCSSSSRV